MKYTIAAIILCFFATIKIVADVFELERLSVIAAITNVTPAMKVFTAQQGYETYSSIFELTVSYSDGKTIISELNPGNYSGLKGPYNRRNVYGALIAYGPVLVSNSKTKPMWDEMARRAFCGSSSVLTELGFISHSGVIKATIKYLKQVQKERDYPSQLSVTCG